MAKKKVKDLKEMPLREGVTLADAIRAVLKSGGKPMVAKKKARKKKASK